MGIWGIQDGSGNPTENFSKYYPTHDHSFCVIGTDGRIQDAIELERLTRVKHDYRLSKYIERLSEYLPDDFIVVSVNHYSGTAFISENGLFRIEGTPLNISELITPTRAFINRKERESYICSHELAHICSILPFVGEFLENSLLIHFDGLASDSCFSVFQYKEGKIKYVHHGWEPLEAIQLFGFNDLICSMLGLDEKHRLAAPGRLMGYSSYGKYNKKLREWLKKNNWFKNHWDNPNIFFNDVRKEFKSNIKEFDLKDPIFMNIASVCQKEFEDTLFELIEKFRQYTKTQYLYLSGGSALNINLNTKLSESMKFKDVYISPCCSDTGLALGAACAVQKLRERKISIHSPFINSIGVEEKQVPNLSEKMVDNIADRLNNKEVMGVCIGFSESGPRALGHRSILAIPNSKRMYDKVNTKIKKREWYRPLAPIIIEDLAGKVFPGSTEVTLSKYMLGGFKVDQKWAKKIPAVVHVDGTARVQVVFKSERELQPIYFILKRIWEKYKIPCLINTSFNVPGEPIVHTDKDALATAQKLGLDFLLINNKIVNIKPNENKT